MDITVSGEWLIQRSEEEVLKVQSLTMSRIRFMFSSKETIVVSQFGGYSDNKLGVTEDYDHLIKNLGLKMFNEQ